MVAWEPCIDIPSMVLLLPPLCEKGGQWCLSSRLGVTEKILMLGRQQALLSFAELHQAPPAVGRREKGPAGQCRVPEQSSTSPVRQPKRSMASRLQKGGAEIMQPPVGHDSPTRAAAAAAPHPHPDMTPRPQGSPRPSQLTCGAQLEREAHLRLRPGGVEVAARQGQYPRVWHLPQRQLSQAVPGRLLAAASSACAGRHVPSCSPGRPVREGHRMRRERESEAGGERAKAPRSAPGRWGAGEASPRRVQRPAARFIFVCVSKRLQKPPAKGFGGGEEWPVIHADAGWPRARDEREPMCGEPGGEHRLNPSAGPRGTVPWGYGLRCPRLGHSLCATTTTRKELPFSLCLSFPVVGTGGQWPLLRSKETPGSAAR